MRTVDVRIDVYRDGRKLTELLPAAACTITMKKDAKIKTSLSGSTFPNSLVDWLTDELHPMLVIDGEEHPCGVFLPATVKTIVSDGVKSVKLAAYDRCWLLQTNMLTETLHYTIYKTITTAVVELLRACGIERIDIRHETTTLPTQTDWSVGTDYLTIINELLAMINYEQVWFDEDGVAVCRPKEAAVEGNAKHSYTDTDISCMLLPTVEEQLDIYDAPNVFVCVANNPERSTVWTSTAENDRPSSPLSTFNRGRRIVKKVNVQNIASQAHLDVYARQLMVESMQMTEEIGITTALQPGHGVGDICGISAEGISGYAREIEWKMDLVTGGNMTHKLERLV